MRILNHATLNYMLVKAIRKEFPESNPQIENGRIILYGNTDKFTKAMIVHDPEKYPN